MTDKQTKSIGLVLTNDWPNGRIAVDMEAFFDFSFWLSEELEDLVEHWRHNAAPRATGFRRAAVPQQNRKKP